MYNLSGIMAWRPYSLLFQLLLFSVLKISIQFNSRYNSLQFIREITKLNSNNPNFSPAEPFIEKIKDTFFPQLSNDESEEKKTELDIMR